jgi:hypothetical protein
MGKIHRHVPRIHSSDLLAIVDERGFGIGSSKWRCMGMDWLAI